MIQENKENKSHICDVCESILEADKENLFFVCTNSRCRKKYFKCENCGCPVAYDKTNKREHLICECGSTYNLVYIESKVICSETETEISDESEEEPSEYSEEDMNNYY